MDNSMRAGPDQLNSFLVAHTCCDDQNSSLEFTPLRLENEVQRAFGPEVEIQQDQGGLGGFQLCQRLGRGFARGHYSHVGFFIEGAPESLAKHRMIVDHQQTNLLLGWILHCAFSGGATCKSTAKQAPSLPGSWRRSPP